MKHILSSPLLSQFENISQGTSTKFFGPLSFTYSKDANKVIIDRFQFLTELWINQAHSVLICEQNHTDNIICIRDEHIDQWLCDYTSQIPNTDGMITNLTKVNLIVYTADCMPMTFFDPIKKVIGIAHSGWRGTIAGIGIKMIELMKTEYWSDVGDIRVAIGPSIWPCCYTCKNQEQISLFEEKYSQIIHRDENVCVDLWDSIEKDILSIGIAPEHFENPRICTACHHDIYASHRADHPNTTTNLTTISISE